jgi:hypothetical protein
MPFSAGTFSLYTPGNPVVTGTTISSTWANNTLQDIGTGLSTCVLKDGTQTITANIPMAGFKFTGLGAGTASGNSIRYEQVNGVVTTAGDLLYATGAGVLARLAIGTAGQFLQVNAGATAPQWNDLDPITSSLGANVTLNNTGAYFDGPSIAQGTAGTWFVSGTVTCWDTAGLAYFNVKLWDGTTVIASARGEGRAANVPVAISVSGQITSPAGNLRISVQDTSSTSGVINFNASGNSKDSTITAIRIG